MNSFTSLYALKPHELRMANYINGMMIGRKASTATGSGGKSKSGMKRSKSHAIAQKILFISEADKSNATYDEEIANKVEYEQPEEEGTMSCRVVPLERVSDLCLGATADGTLKDNTLVTQDQEGDGTTFVELQLKYQ